MNEYLYNISNAERLNHMQSLYDYTRNQNIAEQKSEDARKYYVSFMFSVLAIIILLLSGWIALIYLQRKKREELQRINQQHSHDVEMLVKAQSDLFEMNEQQHAILMNEKSKYIERLQQKVMEYKDMQNYHKLKTVEERLADSNIVKRLHYLAAKLNETATSDDWHELQILINKELPEFYSTLNTGHNVLKKIEYNICILIRLHFSMSEISLLTNIKSASLTMIRTRLLEKVYGEHGGAKDFDQRIYCIK